MIEKKSNWATKLLPDNLKSVLWGAVGALVLIILIQPLSDSYWQRAEISAKVQRLVFSREIDAPEWQLTFIVRLANTGRTPLVLEYRNLNLNMPLLSTSEYSFHIGQTRMIPENTVQYDTVKTFIPNIFNTPTFKNGLINIYSPDNSVLTTIIFDSSNVRSYLVHNSVTKPFQDVFRERADRLEGVTYDSTTGSVTMNFEKYYINYGGRVYENHVYAPGTKITHKYVGDKIILNYLQSGNSRKIEGGAIATLVSPRPIFIPHEFIRDKIEFPKITQLLLTHYHEEDGVLQTKYEKIILKDNMSQFFYTFKN